MNQLENREKRLLAVTVFFLASVIASVAHAAIIIDHTCTTISQIPDYWINKAKTDFRISYGHTSHGSQIVTGMEILKDAYGSLYDYNHEGSAGALSLHDGEPWGDLGNPDRTSWAQRTRDLLNTPGNDRNMIMWSWCGQVSDASESDINTYLTLMNQLEIDFPDVTFIYMTGHLDGTGEEGNLHTRNNQIRNYCIANNKVLFDFAEIESYDPDGNYFLSRGADDGCYYDAGNWADQWCNAHPGECASCDCAHSRCLNCQRKGKAFWWMMARLAGWNQGATTSTTTTIDQADMDGDGVPDGNDNCPNISNPDQLDTYPPQGNNCGDMCDYEGDFEPDGDVDGTDAFNFKHDFLRIDCSQQNRCNGDFECDRDVDGTDAFIFKKDFFRPDYPTNCNPSGTEGWCVY